jgi:hypothetical protein
MNYIGWKINRFMVHIMETIANMGISDPTSPAKNKA